MKAEEFYTGFIAWLEKYHKINEHSNLGTEYKAGHNACVRELVENCDVIPIVCDIIAENKELIEERENDHDEIIVLKSQLLVSEGWGEYYKKKITPLRLMHKAELIKNEELIGENIKVKKAYADFTNQILKADPAQTIAGLQVTILTSLKNNKT